MDMWVLHSAEEWEKVRPDAAQAGDGSLNKEQPRLFPCIVIQAYAGAGWNEIDFVYPEDFNRQDSKYRNGIWQSLKG